LSVLWILPLLFVAVGAAAVGYAARQAAQVAAGLREECARLDEVRVALLELRNEAAATCSGIDDMRARRQSAADRR
jgi:hypothetical protein